MENFLGAICEFICMVLGDGSGRWRWGVGVGKGTLEWSAVTDLF